jgi:hypothetical protein
MARGFQKTPEELEEQKRLQAERYPEVDAETYSPTEDSLQSLKETARLTPLGKSIMGAPPVPETFEMSPEIKRYGYKLFGMEEATPSDVQIPFPVGEEPEEIPEEVKIGRAPATLEKPEVELQKAPSIKKQAAKSSSQVDLKEEPLPKKASDIEKMLKQSEEDEDRIAMLKQGAKLRDAVIGFGGGFDVKTDTGMYEDLEKRAQRPMRNLLLKQEVEDKQAKSDPSSELSRLARESLGKLGMNMSGFDNVSYSQLEKLYPSLTQALYTKIAADARKDTIEQSRLDRQMIREAAAQAKMERTSMLSDRQITPINDADTAIANLDAVLALAKDEYVGPLDARIPDTISSADSMAFRSATGRMTDAYRKMITGAGASAFELQKLEANLPKPTDTVAQFKAKAKVFRDELNRGKQIYLKNLRKQGKNVSEFQDVMESEQQLSPEEQLKLIGEQLAAGDKRLQDLKNKKGN